MKLISNASAKTSISLLRITALLMFALTALALSGCDDGGSDYGAATTAEEEASHYHYDSEGHIYDDRD
jgi:hypothetical protein